MKTTIPIASLRRGVLGIIASLAVLGAASAADAAQSPLYPSWKGIKQFGTPGEEQAYVSALDRRGNLYVTGYTMGDLDGPGPGVSAGAPELADLYVMKLNRDGQVEWIRQFGLPSDDRAHSIAVDHRGHVYVTGHTEGDLDGPGPEVHSGHGDAFLVKLDENGQVLWLRQFGTADEEFGLGVALDRRGNPYVTGLTSGDMDGDGPGTNAGNDDVFLAAFDGTGDTRWVRQIGSPDQDLGYVVASDARGYVYVTGRSLGDLDGPGPQTHVGGWDIIALKFDSRGELKWSRQFGTAGDDWSYAIAADRHRHLYISGFVSGDFDGDGPDVYAGGADITVLKMKNDGDVVWSRQLGSAGHEFGFGVAVDGSGNVYVTGTVFGDLDGPGPEISAGSYDLYVMELNRDRQVKWIRQRGTPGEDSGINLLLDRKRQIYVTGQTQGDLDGPGPGTHAGDFDLFLWKLRGAKVKH